MNAESTETFGGRAASTIVGGVIIALVVAGLAALVVGGVSRAHREEIRSRGTEAALALAEKGKGIIAEFRKRDRTKSWEVRKLEVSDFDPEGKLYAIEALVLYGETMVASASPGYMPMAVRWMPGPASDSRVQVLRGSIVRKGPQGSVKVGCLQFKTAFVLSDGTTQGSVRVIVPLEE